LKRYKIKPQKTALEDREYENFIRTGSQSVQREKNLGWRWFGKKNFCRTGKPGAQSV